MRVRGRVCVWERGGARAFQFFVFIIPFSVQLLLSSIISKRPFNTHNNRYRGTICSWWFEASFTSQSAFALPQHESPSTVVTTLSVGLSHSYRGTFRDKWSLIKASLPQTIFHSLPVWPIYFCCNAHCVRKRREFSLVTCKSIVDCSSLFYSNKSVLCDEPDKANPWQETEGENGV